MPARAQGHRSRSFGTPGRCLAVAIHHKSSLFFTRAARRRRLAFDISTRHSAFRLQCPPRAPWRLPDPPAIPLQINAIGATPTARGGTFTHPTEFDTFRHFSTLLSNSVESPIPAAAFASYSHLTWGVSSRWERGCSRLALFRKNVFRKPSTTLSVVPKMMRSDDSGECPSPAAGRVSNGQGTNLDLARMLHLRSQRGAMSGPQPMVGEISGLESGEKCGPVWPSKALDCTSQLGHAIERF